MADLSSLSKSELQALARNNSVDDSGTKEELVKGLQDANVEAPEQKENVGEERAAQGYTGVMQGGGAGGASESGQSAQAQQGPASTEGEVSDEEDDEEPAPTGVHEDPEHPFYGEIRPQVVAAPVGSANPGDFYDDEARAEPGDESGPPAET